MRSLPASASVRLRDAETSTAQFAADVRFYLMQQPRQLPSRYLYDSLGSALFDAICRLPWYRVTRAETTLLTRHRAEILGAVGPLARVVELGAGTGEKLATLLAARRSPEARLHVHLVDVSRAALDTAARVIGSLENVELIEHQAPYEAGLESAMVRVDPDRSPAPRKTNDRTLVLFLGSNIGNFDPPAARTLLRGIRASLRPGDALLLGADLIKPARELQLAYDDPLGVTAAFNRNLLVRINRELGADFDIENFRHHVVWNGEASRIEMHLVSACFQRVRIPSVPVDITLREGEAIWTESSYKYRPEEVASTLERCGFRRRTQWIDREVGFALTLVGVPS